MVHALRTAALAALAIPLSARAQAAIPLEQLAGAVKPGSWTYASTATVNGQSQEFGRRTVAIVPVTYRSASAWLVLDTQRNPAASVVDSLFVGRDDLSSLRRVMRLSGALGDMTLTMDFSRESISGQMSANGQTQAISMPNAAGSMASDAVVLTAIAALPLREDWTGALAVVSPQARGTTPLMLAVTGSERVTVPAGTFDTWVVRAAAGPMSATYYVAKGGPVVKVVALVAQTTGSTVETVLQAATPGR